MIKSFGKRLKIARNEKGLSQKGLGLALGLSDKTISSYESGRSYPNLEMLEKFAEILGKPLQFFLIQDDRQATLSQYLSEITNKQNQLESLMRDLESLLKQEE
jgi:transcriptional regulator with XRE-family HTH domain